MRNIFLLILIACFLNSCYQKNQNIDTSINIENYISVNHRNIISKNNITDGICYGNSILQGTGSNGIENTIPRKVAKKLQTYTKLGTVNNWSPDNLGVGGSTTATVAQYVADKYNFNKKNLR